MKKISFLIAAHNEEKIIFKTLSNLSKIPYSNYEVLIGLDGCTDNTEKIVDTFLKKHKKFKKFKLNLREGKPAVINEIIKKSKGEIIVINDADWIFYVKDKKSLEEFISIFDDKEVGGICENLPLEWNTLTNDKNLGFKMVAWSSYFWYNFQKIKFTKREKEFLVLKEPALFMTNIFRKKLYKKNSSLGDDFERTYDIMGSGNKIIIPLNKNFPRMKPVYDFIPVRDLFKQKVRTAKARDQISKDKNKKINVKNYYIPSTIYILKESWKKGVGIGLMMFSWVAITSVATFWLNLKKFDTRKGWSMRVRR